MVVVIKQEKKAVQYGNSVVVVLDKTMQQFLELSAMDDIIVECSLNKQKQKYLAVYKKEL